MLVTAPSRTLTPLETVTSILFGRAPDTPPLERRAELSPMGALEQALLEALHQRPCLIAYSGGRDSSALLAVAVRLARAHGLEPPVPVTLRFPDAGLTMEDEWQELVVERLGCADWIRLEHHDDLDLIGPTAMRAMAWDGLPYPYNLHLLLPMLEAAAGGALVTGVGGDQTLLAAGRELDVLARRVRPVPRDGLRIAFAVAPAALRRPVLRRRLRLTLPWLSDAGNEALTEAAREQEVRRTLRWDFRLREMWRSRVFRLMLDRIDTLGRLADSKVVHPFLDPRFVSALAAAGGRSGFADRTAAMRALFADELPDRVTARGTKASFDEVLFNRHSRRYVGELDEARLSELLRGLAAEELVDPAALLAHWRTAAPIANSFLLLQACRLADGG
jgi:asparagine synthetase B (glutamine-hydrolysing)